MFGQNQYPSDMPPQVCGCLTLDEYMKDAAWQLRHEALHGTPEQAAVLFAQLLEIGGDMRECAEVLLAFNGYHQIVLDRAAELARRGVDVGWLYQSTAALRAFNQGVTDGTMLDQIARMICGSDAGC